MRLFSLLICWVALATLSAQTITNVSTSPNPAYTGSSISAAVSYSLPNGCWSYSNYTSSWSGTTLNVYANFNNSGGACPQVILTGSFSVYIGALSAGSYTIRVYNYDNGALMFTRTFTVTSTGCTLPANYIPNTTNISSTSATLVLSNVSGYSSYEWHYRPSSSSAWTTVSSSSNSRSISGLSSATTYVWQVRVLCSSGTWSSWINGPNFTTSSGTNCAAPGGLTTSSITQNTAIFNWNAVSGASTYSVDFYNGSWTTIGTTSGTSMSVYGLWANTSYQWRVRTNCSSGQQSNLSATATFYTPSAPNCSSGTQFPSNALTPSSSWQYQPLMWGGEYCVMNVTSGTTYTFSYCSANGGVMNFDGQLSIRTTANQLIAYSDNYCGSAPKLVWRSSFTGQVRLLLTKYNCLPQATNSTLAYRIGNYAFSGETDVRSLEEPDTAFGVPAPDTPLPETAAETDTSATERQPGALVIAPNPSSGLFYVKSSALIAQVSVYDMAGTCILTRTTDTEPIDLSARPAGVYMLEVVYEAPGSTTERVRLLKQ